MQNTRRLSAARGTLQLIRRSRAHPGLSHAVLAALSTLLIGNDAAAQTVSQSPLSAVSVPGNLLLVPSVEWPTLDSMANLGDYDVSRTYVGYFDANKCYLYSYSSNEPDRYFYPTSKATNRTCSYSLKQWSGNYMNWAATQTIDPFRKALTGGYRVKDDATTTWLEKARFDDNGGNGIYPDRRIPASGSDATLVRGATPANLNDLTVRIWQLGNRMRFTRSGDLDTTTPTAYDPSKSIADKTVYEVSVRVKVCDASIGVETNCKQYAQGWKPEGLIQKYSERIRYSVFGYLNDSEILRDGGVLRAQQKFVGPNEIHPLNGASNNANREWDPATGMLVRNPDSADASATTSAVGTTIADSGVINYINKFGQMTTQNHKSYDPVSELYYTAIRYLKKQGNVSQYTALSGTATQKFNLADGFPIIVDWKDPIQYWCQNNAILGIGDVYTHRDKNLPGNSVTTDEPSRPSDVSSDATVNVVTATQKVAQLEGITIATPFTGRENSAYIAGLAYDSHTKDLRTDLQKMQTVSTHWVDVRENQVLEGRARNQYWLAAKYGGFEVPEKFDPYTRTTALDTAWWSSSDTLSTGDVRPENFYVASEADKMVESLTRAFAKIAAESAGSASAPAASSTRVETDTRTFQAEFYVGTWRGDLKAYAVKSDGSLSDSTVWRADTQLKAKTWSTRKIYVYNPQGGASAKYALFTWANLGSTQTAALGTQTVVDYLRGDRSNEEAQKEDGLRTRTGVLGDIVNSTPIYVAKPNPRLHAGATYAGASDYATFASTNAKRTAVLYVGANDGMLHGFDAATGDETYAFVPNAVILNGLRQYSDPAYEHRYFVDGEIAVADIYDTGDKKWKTVLVGTLGRGGPGAFALDITDPAKVSFLWEKNGTDVAALGKNLGRPVIAQVADGDWRVLLGNGPGSTAGAAQLVTIRLRDGAVTTINTGATGSNGLAAVLARDADADGFAETAYAGDMLGNLWKFANLASGSSPTKLFEARDPSNTRQPITAAPLAGKDPSTAKTWVFFGTGRHLDTPDLQNLQVQSWYGLQDTGSSISGRSDLEKRDIVKESTVAGVATREIEKGTTAEITTKKGWYIDFVSPKSGIEGERMVAPNRFEGTALIGVTRMPDKSPDPCKLGGRGFAMAIDPFTGARLPKTFFDVSGDGKFDDQDLVAGEVQSGFGIEDGSNSGLVIGDNYYYSDGGGGEKQKKFQKPNVQATRMNWREIIN